MKRLDSLYDINLDFKSLNITDLGLSNLDEVFHKHNSLQSISLNFKKLSLLSSKIYDLAGAIRLQVKV